jgi:hypothetical protein
MENTKKQHGQMTEGQETGHKTSMEATKATSANANKSVHAEKTTVSKDSAHGKMAGEEGRATQERSATKGTHTRVTEERSANANANANKAGSKVSR